MQKHLQRRESLVWFCGQFAKCATLFVFIICAFLMGALILAGLWDVTKGIAIVFHLVHAPKDAADHSSAALTDILKGLEFLFLAPIPILVVPALVKFVLNGFGYEAASLPNRTLGFSFQDVKSFTVGLMIAVLATNLIGVALSKNGLTYETAISGCLVIFTLLLYYFGLHLIGKHTDSDGAKQMDVLTKSVLTHYEWQKLVGLCKEGPFLCKYTQELCAEVKRLVALDFVGGNVDRLSIDHSEDSSGSLFDVKDYVYISPSGREYMKFRSHE